MNSTIMRIPLIVSLQRALIAVLTLLLVGCPDPNRLGVVQSNNIPTDQIVFDLSVRQIERDDSVTLRVTPFQYDGSKFVAKVDLQDGDTLKASVVDQDIDLVTKEGRSSFTFTVNQSSLHLPAKLKLEFMRPSGQVSALETYITINALFETISPIDGAIFSRDEMVDFAWTLRDGDGNTVEATDEFSGIRSELYRPDAQLIVRETFAFDSVNPGPDGFSRTASLPGISIVPAVGLATARGDWRLRLFLDGTYISLNIPTVFSVDPALANDESVGRLSAIAYPNDPIITIR